MWSVVAALYPVEQNVNRTISYPHYTTVLNFDDIEFLMTLKNIGKFKHLNNVSINIVTSKPHTFAHSQDKYSNAALSLKKTRIKEH